MKKFLFLILLTISHLISSAQSQFYFAPNEYGTFKVSSQAQCGLGSVYCMVVRSASANEYGNYVYQIYFATNSYFPNCGVARTYIPDISIRYLEGKNWLLPYNFHNFWLIVGQTSLGYTLFHPSPYVKFYITTGPLQPTNY